MKRLVLCAALLSTMNASLASSFERPNMGTATLGLTLQTALMPLSPTIITYQAIATGFREMAVAVHDDALNYLADEKMSSKLEEVVVLLRSENDEFANYSNEQIVALIVSFGI